MLSIQRSYTEKSDLILNGRPARFGIDLTSRSLSQAGRQCSRFCSGNGSPFCPGKL
jgi:hypothetical protein